MIEELICLFERDLAVLERELALYPTDESLWVSLPGAKSPGGNLALHLIGNLRHFVGHVLGGTAYQRTREVEFSTPFGRRADLIEEVHLTAKEVRAALENLDPARLREPFPLEVGDARPLTGLFLMHLTTHLGFHLGQIDYHRRIATGDATSAGPTSPQALKLGSRP